MPACKQYTAIRYTDRLAEAGIAPSIGSIGDSFDNAMAESIIGLYKTEVIHLRERWDSLEQVGWETMRWVAWFNHDRIYEALGDIPPAEFETNHYRQTTPTEMAGVTQRALRHTRTGSLLANADELTEHLSRRSVTWAGWLRARSHFGVVPLATRF